MRRIRVRWARVLIVLLAAAVVVLGKKTADQAAQTDEQIEVRVAAEVRFLVEQERVKTMLKELNEARLLVHGRSHEEVRYGHMGDRASARVQQILELEYGPSWRFVDYELCSSGSGGRHRMTLEPVTPGPHVDHELMRLIGMPDPEHWRVVSVEIEAVRSPPAR